MGLILKNQHTLVSLSKLLGASTDVVNWMKSYSTDNEVEVSYDLDSEQFCVISNSSNHAVYLKVPFTCLLNKSIWGSEVDGPWAISLLMSHLTGEDDPIAKEESPAMEALSKLTEKNDFIDQMMTNPVYSAGKPSTSVSEKAVEDSVFDWDSLSKSKTIPVSPPSKWMNVKGDKSGVVKLEPVIDFGENIPAEVLDSIAKGIADDIDEAVLKEVAEFTLEDFTDPLSPQINSMLGVSVTDALFQSTTETKKKVDPLHEFKDKTECNKAIAKIMALPKVPLKSATSLYQPVSSTNAESIYWVVAIGEKIAVAARLKGTGLSIRAEGHTTTYGSQLAAAGFTKKEDGHYSNHFNVSNKLIAKRALGAALFSLDIPFRRVALDLSPIFDQ